MVVEYLSTDEVAAFLTNLEGKGARDELMCRLLLYTGMRIGELAPLVAADLDAKRGSVTLSKIIVTPSMLRKKETHGSKKRPAYNAKRELTFIMETPDGKGLAPETFTGTPAQAAKRFPSGELIKRGLKAGQPTRLVPLADRTTLAMLEDYVRGLPLNRFVWVSQKGGRISIVQMYRMISKTMERAGIPREKAHPHILRHTFAVHFLKRTRDLGRLQRILGHTDIATTTIYLRFAFEDLREALEQAGDLYR